MHLSAVSTPIFILKRCRGCGATFYGQSIICLLAYCFEKWSLFCIIVEFLFSILTIFKKSSTWENRIKSYILQMAESQPPELSKGQITLWFSTGRTVKFRTSLNLRRCQHSVLSKWQFHIPFGVVKQSSISFSARLVGLITTGIEDVRRLCGHNFRI